MEPAGPIASPRMGRLHQDSADFDASTQGVRFASPLMELGDDDDSESPDEETGVYAYSSDEVDDLHFAFDACISAETEEARGGKVLEISMLFHILYALTASADSDDITRDEVDRLVSKAKYTLAETEDRNAAKEKENEGKAMKGAHLVTGTVGGAMNLSGAIISGVIKMAHVKAFQGMLSKAHTHKSTSDEVNFSEFFLMLTDEETIKYLPDGNIGKAAFNIRVLKYAFGLIDENGNNSLNFDEFRKAADALSTSPITEEIAADIWEIVGGDVKNPKYTVDFVGFVTGMSDVQRHPVFSTKFNLFETNVLLSMIVDLPVSKVEETKLLSELTGLEKVGMNAAKNSDNHEWTAEKRQEVMLRVENREVHMLSEGQLAAMNFVHKRNVYQGAIIGFISGLVCALWENILTYMLHTDGLTNPFHCIPDNVGTSAACIGPEPIDPDFNNGTCGCIGPTADGQRMDPFDEGTRKDWDNDPLYPHCAWRGILKFRDDGLPSPEVCVNRDDGSNDNCDFIRTGQCEATTDPILIFTFWGLLIACIIIACIIEIGALYWYSIKNSVLVADALDMHLSPLNKDRCFVGLSLVRAALELGNSNSVVFGVDPLKDGQEGAAWMVALFTLVYKAKIVLTGFIVKIAIKRVMGRGGAKYALPWAAVPATAFWDAMVAHLVMVEAKLRGNGVATSVEVFQDILYDLDIPLAEETDAFKMQIVRAVGCNISKARDFYPAKEILLRHVVQEMGFETLLAEQESGDLDDSELFLSTMAELSGPEMKVVLEVLVLCTVLDGNANRRERKFYEAAMEACHAVDQGKQFFVHEGRVRKLAQDYRMMIPITKAGIQDCLDDSEHGLGGMYYVNECAHFMCSLLICI